MKQALEYVTGNYTVRHEIDGYGNLVGYAVWHDDDTNMVRILDSLAYKGQNFNKLKDWFEDATDTTRPIILNVEAKNQKLMHFYQKHGFVICEETPYAYIMKKEGDVNGI